MKNAMKKLLSLVLVAMLLVSAVPFQASAAEGYYVNVVVKLDGVAQDPVKKDIAGATTTVGNLIDYKITQDLSAYDFTHAWVAGKGQLDREDVVNSGDTVEFAFVSKVQKYCVNVVVKLDGVAQSPVQKEIAGEQTTVGNLIDYKINQDLSAYNFDHAWIDGKGSLGRDGVVDAGDTVEFAFVSKPQTVEAINIVVKVESSDNVVWTGSKVPANKVSAKVEDLLAYCWNKDWDDVYTFDHAWSEEQGKTVAKSGSINAGDTVYIMVNKNTTTNPPASGEYIYMRVYVDNSSVGGTQKKIEAASATVDSLIKNWKSDWTTGYEFNYYTINSSKVAYTSRNDTVYAGDTVYIYMNSRSTSGGTSKYNSNKVRLHVFLNGKVDEAARTFDITNNLAADYTVSLKEVSNYLLNYYSAKDSKGINFDGLYLVKGNWLGAFIRDGKVDTIADIDDKLEQGYVDINIMLDNATAKTTSTADSSNPKTGDSIYMTVTVMGLSVAALAAVYYVSKKRVVR